LPAVQKPSAPTGEEPQPEPCAASVDDLLNAILGTTAEEVLVLSLSGEVLFWSGVGRLEDRALAVSHPRGSSWFDSLPLSDRRRGYEAIEVAKGGRIGTFQTEFSSPSGPIPADITVKAITRRDGTPDKLLVSERHISEPLLAKELRDTKERYEALIEATAIMMWRAAPDGAVVEVSGHRQALWAQTREMCLGDGWLDAIHVDDRKRVTSYWRDLVARPRTDTVEYRVRGSDGRYRCVLSRAVPVVSADGTVREWVGTVVDIDERKLVDERLREQREGYRAIVEASASAFWRATPDGSIQEVFGWGAFRPEDWPKVSGSGWLLAVHPDDRERVRSEWKSALKSGEPVVSEYRIEIRQTYTWVEARAVPMRGQDGCIREWVGTIANISRRKEAEENLHISEERYRLVARATRDAIWDHNLVTDQITWGEASQAVFGYAERETGPAGDWWTSRIHEEDRERVVESLRDAISTGEPHWQSEYRFLKADGSYADVLDQGFTLRDKAGKVVRLVGAMQDISARKAAERELSFLANHDPLTGLANRALFQSRLQQVLREAERSGGTASLLVIDLDDFKDVNDTLGHDAGDAMLFEAARRIGDGAADAALVARLGGDEFAIIVAEPLERAIETANGIQERIRVPFSYEGSDLTTRVSIGLAAFPDHDRTANELLKDADMALYKAKSEGRDRVQIYLPALRADMEGRVSTVAAVRKALGEGRFVPFYQPKVCLSSGRVIGFEALARWLHPTNGALTPYHFQAALEDREVCILIGREMVNAVCKDIRTWLDQRLDCGRVAVNFSPVEFKDAGLARRVLRAINDACIPTSCFEVEITETVFLGSKSAAGPTLRTLHESGVQIALDDFGTGFSSLSHLKQFPVDRIKIDQSFVRDIEADDSDAAIVRAVIGLGRSLDLEVTAEGVETEGQYRWLVANGCEQAQGYLFAKPMSASRVPWFLTNWKGEGLFRPQPASRAS
jgi:diguanylate cyclase (GGDEF)-like protein/PAS domain S-box-containing protein